MERPVKPRIRPKVKRNYAWAVMDRDKVVEVSLDRYNLPALCKGERLIKIELVV